MTSNYDEFYDPDFSLEEENDEEAYCFELLSAYIDGEATTEERQQVQQWLDNDPEIKKTYLQLLKLQGGMQSLTVPSSTTVSTEVLTDRVFQTIDRRNNRKRVAVWSSAIAATIMGAVWGTIPSSNSPSFRIAEEPSPRIQVVQPVKVAVSLNKPAVIIPKAAVATHSQPKRI